MCIIHETWVNNVAYSWFYDCKSLSSNAIEVRNVYANVACNFETVPKYACDKKV